MFPIYFFNLKISFFIFDFSQKQKPCWKEIIAKGMIWRNLNSDKLWIKINVNKLKNILGNRQEQWKEWQEWNNLINFMLINKFLVEINEINSINTKWWISTRLTQISTESEEWMMTIINVWSLWYWWLFHEETPQHV